MEPSLRLIKNYYSIISRAHEESKYFDSLPLNRFWAGENLKTMRSIISDASSLQDVIHNAQKTFMFSVNSSEQIKERAVDWLLTEQHSRDVDISTFPKSVQESSHSFPDNNVLRGGRILTPDFLRTVNIGVEIQRSLQLRDRKVRIVELGGGLGHLARTLRLMGVSCSHLIIDLPETLVFSYGFLKSNFPDSRFLLIDNYTQVSEIQAGSYDFAFLPVSCADFLREGMFDLFVNTASMGEMRNEVIRHWMSFIQTRIRPRYLITLNRYLNTIDPAIHGWRLDENECSVHYDQLWRIMKWELEPSFTRCPYLDPLIARYVLIIAERLQEKSTEECIAKSQALIEEVKFQDWWRLSHQAGDMTMRENVLVNDMTVSGTLFKLWESIRLCPSAEVVAMLLVYLDTLLRCEHREFEEVKYYQELFLSIYERVPDSGLKVMAENIRWRLQYRERITAVKLIAETSTFNLVQAGDRYLAVSKWLGPTELFRERLGERDLVPLLLSGETLDEVRAKVQQFAGEVNPPPSLLETYLGYNLVEAEGRYWAVATSMGPTELFKERLGHRDLAPLLFSADTLDEVKTKVQELAPRVSEGPRLLEAYQGYNLVAYEGIVWAVAIAAGPVDLTKLSTRNILLSREQLICATTVEDARLLVERKECKRLVR